jgi:hypothetical protein
VAKAIQGNYVHIFFSNHKLQQTAQHPVDVVSIKKRAQKNRDAEIS